MRKPLERHGDSYSVEYRAWISIRERCFHKTHKAYSHYGGRGITMCEEWTNSYAAFSYAAFLAYVGRKPTPEHSLDRFPNNNGNYEPGNVRWATWDEQNNNKRDNTLIEYNGERKTWAQWAHSRGMSSEALLGRIKKKWSLDKALNTPILDRSTSPQERSSIRRAYRKLGTLEKVAASLQISRHRVRNAVGRIRGL